MKKSIKFCLILFFIAALFTGCSDKRTASPADPAAVHSGLYVDGTALRTASGEQVVLRGINHAHCWYRSEDETAFAAIADTGANCIRIVCACGIQWEADTAESIAAAIERARELGMLSIVEVHDGTGDNSIETLKSIGDFWCGLSDVLAGTEGYCIVNIANEWCGKHNADTWKDGYTGVIPMLRGAGIKNVIMVDAPGWGQYGKAVGKTGIDIFESDPERNTMFSVHMYGFSGGSERSIRAHLNAGLERNLCVCVGEFGYTHSDGDVKEDYLMQYCTEQDIGYLAWSWKGNSGGVEYLDLASEWDGSVLSADWGENAVNGKYGIRATSKKILN